FPRHDPIEWPLAKFTFQTDRTEAPVTVDLDASESSDTDGAVMRYEWYFGDGTTALGRHTQKVFDKDGNWEIRLLVRDDHGAVAAYTDAITVGE
ncbi:MAG: PKD domain-containing protein, partial [Silicimonas sp.]|nr:PKD domain-containing protein [Silicimonas sp.]